MTTTQVRKSVPLTPDDTRDLERLRGQPSYQRAYAAVTGNEMSERPSEAEALHALIELGRATLSHQVMLSGYAALAASNTKEDEEIRQAITERRNQRARD